MGHFKILDPSYEQKFWHYFVTDALHDFYSPGSVEEARAFDKMFPIALSLSEQLNEINPMQKKRCKRKQVAT